MGARRAPGPSSDEVPEEGEPMEHRLSEPAVAPLWVAVAVVATMLFAFAAAWVAHFVTSL